MDGFRKGGLLQSLRKNDGSDTWSTILLSINLLLCVVNLPENREKKLLPTNLLRSENWGPRGTY